MLGPFTFTFTLESEEFDGANKKYLVATVWYKKGIRYD